MNVTCGECRSVFRVDPAKIPPGGVRARCSVCGGVFAVTAPPAGAAATATVAPPAPVPAGAPTGTAAPSRSPLAAPTAVRPPSPAPPPGPAAPLPRTAPSAAPALRPAPPPAPAPASAPAASAVPGRVAPAQPGAGPPTPAAGRSAINPFLSNDPGQKAKRLARALVSDIVAYHPQQREQGLRDGTLKVLFKEEIKKSYEEYVEQVGKEFAEGTTHFQEALNEILAGGRKLF